jgi:beta-galactosidase
MSFSASKGYFVKNKKPVFTISGEIHYFRLNPKVWKKHLLLLKKSGADTTSTYIPWDWHEPEENMFDFTGTTHPGRNLVKYISLCKEVGLQLIVKPGPYILAEYLSQGLPSWLVKNIAANARAMDEHGTAIAPDMMTYMSDEFLRYTFLWFDKIMPLVAQYQESNGGPIVMMQVCNEVGVFQWLSGKIDYNNTVIGMFRQFLREKYGDIGKMNKIFGSNITSFENVIAPVGTIENKEQYCLYVDFHLFFRHYYAVYLDTLITNIRRHGVNVQLSHNIPGWIYGNAAELPMLISTYEEVMRTRDDIIFGLDHIPEFFSFRNAHSDLACNKILQAMQPNGPVWAAEFQAGTREHHARCDARDMEAFYLASLAHGMKSFNYYMFSQGTNPAGKGYFGKTFYYQTPLSADGVPSPLYSVTKKIGDYIRREKDDLLLSTSTAHIGIGFYKPYFHTEVTTSQLLKERRLFIEKLGLFYDPRFLREEVLFNGLMRGLQTLNYQYDVKDIQTSDIESLLEYKQLWMVSAEYMDAETQRMLAAFVKKGGTLILLPAVPVYDEYLNPCTILKDELQIQTADSICSHKVDAYGITDIYTLFDKKLIFTNNDGITVSKTKEGKVCGLRRSIGKGTITTLGFAVNYTTDEHLQLYDAIVSGDKIKREAKVSDPDIQCVVRHGKKNDYVFLLNYHNEKKRFTVDSQKIVLEPLSCAVMKRNKTSGRGK